LSDQAQGVVRSAGSLTDMSERLRRLVSRWRLPEEGDDDRSASEKHVA
jgi:hypothetical protein